MIDFERLEFDQRLVNNGWTPEEWIRNQDESQAINKALREGCTIGIVCLSCGGTICGTHGGFDCPKTHFSWCSMFDEEEEPEEDC